MWETDADDLAGAETAAYHFTNARIETIYEERDWQATQERAQVRQAHR
jgi:putative SOS response-associated peptidase YedK